MEKYLVKSKWRNLILGLFFILAGVLLIINFKDILMLFKNDDYVVVAIWGMIEWYIVFVAMILVGILFLTVSVLNFIKGRKINGNSF